MGPQAPATETALRRSPWTTESGVTAAGQLGQVVAMTGDGVARTDHASLRSVGLFTNRALLAGIGFSLLFAAVLIHLPAVHSLFGTAALSPADLATVAPLPFLVWGADELRRAHRRRTAARAHQHIQSVLVAPHTAP